MEYNGTKRGGSVAERSERWTCNLQAPNASLALTASWFVLGRPEFDSSLTLVK